MNYELRLAPSLTVWVADWGIHLSGEERVAASFGTVPEYSEGQSASTAVTTALPVTVAKQSCVLANIIVCEIVHKKKNPNGSVSTHISASS